MEPALSVDVPKGRTMDIRRRARVIGTLFIVATVAAIVGGSLLLPVDEGRGLAEVAGADAQVVTGALLEILMVYAVLGIAVLFFPVLRGQDEGLALGYVAARTMEAVLLLVAASGALVVVAASRGAGVGLDVETVLAVREATYLLGSLVALGVGGLVLYWLLYRSGLVPTWLSLWGLVAAAMILGRGVVEVYGIELSGLAQGILAAPIALNEMVLAVWLIVRGFTLPAMPSVTEERVREVVSTR